MENLNRQKFLFFFCSLFTLFLFQETAFSQTKLTKSVSLSAVLNSRQETPAPTVTGSPTGMAVFTLVTSGGKTQLFYDITVTGLSGPIAAAHLHNAVAGVSGPVVREIFTSFKGTTANGVWSSNDSTQPLTPAFVSALLTGEMYVNVHTGANPQGEIRGQVYPSRMFVAKLDTTQEVPPPAGTAKPTGTAIVILQGAEDGGAEIIANLAVDNLSGQILVGHFHNAPAGTAGPVIKKINFTGNAGSVVWRSTDSSDPLTPVFLRALFDEKLYINVHTEQNKAGEARGQVTLQKVK